MKPHEEILVVWTSVYVHFLSLFYSKYVVTCSNGWNPLSTPRSTFLRPRPSRFIQKNSMKEVWFSLRQKVLRYVFTEVFRRTYVSYSRRISSVNSSFFFLSRETSFHFSNHKTKVSRRVRIKLLLFRMQLFDLIQLDVVPIDIWKQLYPLGQCPRDLRRACFL